jgi:DNA-binding IclR family transcriptional regulator
MQGRVLGRIEPGEGGDAVRTAEELRRVLAEVRRGGYATARQASPPWTTVAAPVRDGDSVVAAVSVVAPSGDFDTAAYVPAVRATARAISRQMNDLHQPG